MVVVRGVFGGGGWGLVGGFLGDWAFYWGAVGFAWGFEDNVKYQSKDISQCIDRQSLKINCKFQNEYWNQLRLHNHINNFLNLQNLLKQPKNLKQSLLSPLTLSPNLNHSLALLLLPPIPLVHALPIKPPLLNHNPTQQIHNPSTPRQIPNTLRIRTHSVHKF